MRQTGADRAIPAVIPGLDGLRAVSILIVMISHSALSHIVPGVFGVTMFFFVSGFLITSLMLAEHRATGTLAIRAFYVRRLLRLYPPLVASIAATAAFYAAIGEPVDWRGVLGALAYLANYLAIFRPDLMQNLGGQLWSLAVEEHFYFVYPLLMAALLPRDRLILKVLAAICLAALCIRFYVDQAHPALAQDYNGKATETRIDSILYGALAAVLWWSGRAQAWFGRNWRALTMLGLALLLASFLWRNPAIRETIRYTAQGLALIPIVLAITVSGRLPSATALLECRPARWIGRRSYSLYLWHLLAFEAAGHLLRPLTGVEPVVHAGGWALAFALAWASYRFVETPFFALRRRFGSNVARIERPAATASSAEAARPPHP